MLISVITPLHNEEENIPELASRLCAAMAGLGDWEWIAVDDGSTDGTKRALEALYLPCLMRLVCLSRNFGQQNALMAGLVEARGDAVIFLDGDQQDPPELIAEFVRAWKAGAMVVYGQRRTRGEPLLRRLLIGGFHHLFSKLTGGVMPMGTGNFGLVDKRVAEILRGMPEHTLYLPALRSWTGFRQEAVAYDRSPRAGGRGLSLVRLFGFAWEAILAFSEAPLRLIAALGVVISAASFLYGGWLLVQRFLQFLGFFKDLEVLGFTTVAVSVFFMGGVQLICLGVIGEYLARVYREVKGRPRFIVASVEAKPPHSPC